MKLEFFLSLFEANPAIHYKFASQSFSLLSGLGQRINIQVPMQSKFFLLCLLKKFYGFYLFQ